MIDAQAAALIGLFLGILARTLFPYLKKAKEAEEAGNELPFNKKFTYTAIYSFVSAGIGAIMLFATYTVPPGLTVIQVGIVAFLAGYVENDIMNRLIS